MNDEFVLSDDDSNDHDCNNDEEMMIVASAKSANDAILLLVLKKLHRKFRKRSHLQSLQRNPSMFDDRLNWDEFFMKFGSRKEFTRHVRMSATSFQKLLSYLHPMLDVDNKMARKRGGQIHPELCLYACLRYLAGRSYSDICCFTGMSIASTYRLIWKTIHAINSCNELQIKFPSSHEEVKAAAAGFASISKEGCIWNCVAVVDGYHLEIITPSKNEVKNIRSFYSGHYKTYGLNIQAASDHHCRFVFFGVAGPGVMGDRDAVKQVKLNDLINSLPGLYCAIADCAYTPSEKMIPVYRGSNANEPRYDNFNFFASQLRIRIEMAFGLMVKKWGILTRPLSIKLKHIKHLAICVARLHNFCIIEQLSENMQRDEFVFDPAKTLIFQGSL